jgi:DNA replication protein DnaC
VAERVIGDRLTAGQTVMFSTNLRVSTPEVPGDFEDYVGDRVWSRINGNMTCTIMAGEDLRPKSATLRAKHGG